MATKEYNNIFNQGVQASANAVDSFTVKPKENKTLTDSEIIFNSLVAQFKSKILENLK